jgi:hypothetical protein
MTSETYLTLTSFLDQRGEKLDLSLGAWGRSLFAAAPAHLGMIENKKPKHVPT